jgi:hypothetical protein
MKKPIFNLVSGHECPLTSWKRKSPSYCRTTSSPRPPGDPYSCDWDGVNPTPMPYRKTRHYLALVKMRFSSTACCPCLPPFGGNFLGDWFGLGSVSSAAERSESRCARSFLAIGNEQLMQDGIGFPVRF